MGVNYSAGPIVRDGLVLYLDAGNPKSYPGSGTTWKDLSGNGNNGTLTNMSATPLDSANGGSLVFDGVNDYGSFGTSLGNGLSQISVSCWVKPTTFPNTNFIFEHLIGACDNSSIGLESVFKLEICHNNTATFLPTSFKGNCIYFGIRTSTQTNRQRPIAIPDSTAYADYTPGLAISMNPEEYALNTWMYLCGVFNGTETLLYINGKFKATSNLQPNNLNGSVSGVLNSSNIARTIGTLTAANGGFFTGNISQTSIHNRALTSQEILQNYNATKGRYGL